MSRELYWETKSAVVTDQDQGVFEALASAYGRDHQGDDVQPDAFEATLRRWQGSGKNIPILFEHRADEIIGHVDPARCFEGREALVVTGQLHLDTSEKARSIWPAMKHRALSLSFGYMTTKEHRLPDGSDAIDGRRGRCCARSRGGPSSTGR